MTTRESNLNHVVADVHEKVNKERQRKGLAPIDFSVVRPGRRVLRDDPTRLLERVRARHKVEKIGDFAIIERLLRARAKRQLTQSDVAAAIGCATVTYASVERGKYQSAGRLLGPALRAKIMAWLATVEGDDDAKVVA